MAHGGYGKLRKASKSARNGNKALAVQQSDKKDKKKSKMASIKNQIRSIQRLLQKNPPAEVKDAQQKHLEDLKKQAGQNQEAELERKMSIRYRRVKFFERRKIERAIKRLEKLKEAGSDILESAAMAEKQDTIKQLAQLKEDLEYVRFFPKTEKYVSLFMGNNDEEVIVKRNKLREQIKANLAAAAATGVEPEEMENYEDPAMEVVSDDDFFLPASDDDAEADDKQMVKTLKPGAFKDHTEKKLPASISRWSLGQKTHKQHQRPLKSPSSSQLSNQNPQSTGNIYEYKGSHFRDERHQSQIRINKNKKQKTKVNLSPSGSQFQSYSRSKPASDNTFTKMNLSPSGSQFQSYSRSNQSYSRSKPASNNTFKIASSVLSSDNKAGFSNVLPSCINSHTVNILPSPEVSNSNTDVKKKRRRKHQPKKKKT